MGGDNHRGDPEGSGGPEGLASGQEKAGLSPLGSPVKGDQDLISKGRAPMDSEYSQYCLNVARFYFYS